MRHCGTAAVHEAEAQNTSANTAEPVAQCRISYTHQIISLFSTYE